MLIRCDLTGLRVQRRTDRPRQPFQSGAVRRGRAAKRAFSSTWPVWHMSVIAIIRA